VIYPLRRIYGDRFRLAPLSVLVDPIRAEQVFGMREGRRFSDKVLYIWSKQVEEADIIVIAKNDLLDASRLEALRKRLAAEFPGKILIDVSVRSGHGAEAWFELLDTTVPGSANAMEVDYNVYADGEALLGWLNATIEFQSIEDLDSSLLLHALATEMKNALVNAEIAHLKMTLSPDQSLAGEIAALSLVRSDVVPELSLKLDSPVRSGQLIVNCRAEASPEELRIALERGLVAIGREFPGLDATLEHVEQFRPGRPQPTHRFDLPEAASIPA